MIIHCFVQPGNSFIVLFTPSASLIVLFTPSDSLVVLFTPSDSLIVLFTPGGSFITWSCHIHAVTMSRSVLKGAPYFVPTARARLVTMFQYAPTLPNVYTLYLPTSSRVFKVSIFQLRHSPFFTWFVLRFTSFS